MKKIFYVLALCGLLVGCDRKYDTPMDDGRFNAGIDDVKPKFYKDQYDPLQDKGQFWHPDAYAQMPELPKTMYGLFSLNHPEHNNPDVPNGGATNVNGDGLQYHLLSQSFSGLVNKALASGNSVTGAWSDAYDGWASYRECQKLFHLAPTWVVHTGNPMTNVDFGPLDGGVMDYLGKNYVLTDVRNNPESGNVAVVASHVYNAFIVDVRDRDFYDANGFKMVYDATHKTTEDSWHEFKDKCNNRALVVMPVHTGELADFAIANNLFVINLNKVYNTASGGQNTALFKEVLAWLQPNSSVFGWEPGVGEDSFVIPVSESGNMMVASQEANLAWFSKDYKNRQKPLLAHVVSPQDIDFSTNKDKKFVSYYLSDGPHSGWMMRGFVENYYTDAKVNDVCMSFGVTASLMCQMDPLTFEKIMMNQSKKSTLIESFGGGYWYSDNFGINGDRPRLLANLAEKVAHHMRQHRIKVLEQIALDATSSAAMEAYQAFVDANNQLEGIIAIDYSPSYAGSEGKILWVTNKDGYDIPVITVRYSIWNMGGQNNKNDGTPTYVAHRLNELGANNKFSAVIVHAWSAFSDTGDSVDELAENAEGGTLRGASAAEMCDRRLDENYETVNIQELIWRVRMEYRPEQTQKYLKEYY